MSDRLRVCRQHLAEALDQTPDCSKKKVESCSPKVLYSSHRSTEPSESSWTTLESGPEQFGLTWSRTEAEAQQDRSGLESSSVQMLDAFVAKLEFEIVLYQVRNGRTLNLDGRTPAAPRRPTGSRVELGADGEEGDDSDDDSRVVDMILEMEQDHELGVL